MNGFMKGELSLVVWSDEYDFTDYEDYLGKWQPTETEYENDEEEEEDNKGV
eukprot:CAMPEP_0168616114 /NCGR_PEP_ID=MMETSP0449_2-20121227/4863_1 /TAXON_ID=1082188 /ORGANISM="Strombidium rassoulzadegani, Strain ras09" /LENGTH=50 /DNA_ID=CAMNT_0008656895 /DNA_START=518 /DNA_END=666 /DNA_ORIENTATION=-